MDRSNLIDQKLSISFGNKKITSNITSKSRKNSSKIDILVVKMYELLAKSFEIFIRQIIILKYCQFILVVMKFN